MDQVARDLQALETALRIAREDLVSLVTKPPERLC